VVVNAYGAMSPSVATARTVSPAGPFLARTASAAASSSRSTSALRGPTALERWCLVHAGHFPHRSPRSGLRSTVIEHQSIIKEQRST
jgi:hypothetical protein